jgi:uncharacterized protein (DUF488 family)
MKKFKLIKNSIDSVLENNESIFPIDSYEDGEKKTKNNICCETSKKVLKRIMVDFDGVLSKYEYGWQDGKLVDEPIERGKESLQQFKDMGFEVVIFTTRAIKDNYIQIENLKKWLEKYDIPYDYITGEKLPAEFYIDDRAIRFENNWNEVVEFVKNNID